MKAKGTRRRAPPPGGSQPRATSGFTLVEVLVAASISMVVMAALMTIILWTSERMTLAEEISWSHMEALRSGRDVINFVRNASSVNAIDTNTWRWVELRMPDGKLKRLNYANPIGGQRDGYMYLTTGTQPSQTIVARGMTAIMTDGFSPPVFEWHSSTPNMLRLRYRLVEPIPTNPGQNCDAELAAIVDTTVCLRNASR